MPLPKIEDVGHGKPVMPFGSDGTDWYAFLIDALGHLQVDVVSAALGSGGATEATLLLIKGYVDALETLLAGGLPAALDSGALKIKEQSPLTGFATAANQAIIAGYIDALETLLAGGLPAALDSGALKTKEQSPLTGFATSANQTTMITALQLIDDLRNALGSVNTDDLQVDVKTYPGSNVLGNFPFGYYAQTPQIQTPTYTSTGWKTLDIDTVPAGEVWTIPFLSFTYTTGVVSNVAIGATDFTNNFWNAYALALAVNDILVASAPVVLSAGYALRAFFYVATQPATCWFKGLGYKMKVA